MTRDAVEQLIANLRALCNAAPADTDLDRTAWLSAFEHIVANALAQERLTRGRPRKAIRFSAE